MLVLNDEPVELAQLSTRLKGKHVSMSFQGRGELVRYPRLLAIVKALGNVEIARLVIIDPMQVEISAEIDGRPAMCRLSVDLMDNRGISMADRAKARAAAN